ncbi:MAG TPA: HEAT repeat domain-containing protein [Polyangia bacterium]|nr:HEAT repeat domain-containing protein [Polyangia bacterium]
MPLPSCWAGLLEFDQSATLASMHAAIAAAALSGDNVLIDFLKERLAELVGDNVHNAMEVLNWAEKVTGPELAIYMESLKTTGAVQNPKVSDRLLAMGENSKSSLENRLAALDTLETQKHFAPETQQRVKALALDDKLEEVAWVATRTLGRVAKEDFERTGNYQDYWKDLLDIGKRSGDAGVRALALEMPSYAEPLVDGKSIDSLGNILRTDPDPHVREMAAHRLGLTDDPDKALDTFRASFNAEKDLCLRWAIFRFALRAAGPQALPLVQQFAAADPRFLKEYEEFKAIYDRGVTDFARVWAEKPENIQCIGEEE